VREEDKMVHAEGHPGEGRALDVDMVVEERNVQ